MAIMRLCITPRLMLRSLLACFGVLLAMNVLMLIAKFGFGHNYVFGLVQEFNFDVEQNMPTMYNALLFVLASLLCFLATKVENRGAGKWMLLGIVFIALAVDEFTSIHEELVMPVQIALSTSGFFYFAWIIPYFVIVVVLFLILIRWLIGLPKELRAGMLVSAFMYLSGVFLMEGIGGWYYSGGGGPERTDAVYYSITTVEESLEMLGLIVFIYFVSKYLAASFDYLQLAFSEKR